jgi:cardiolipin synthase
MIPLKSFFRISAKNSERWLTLANCLTLTRIALIPFIVRSIHGRDWEQATLLFLCAALTDLLDGMVARARSEITLLGACLDPIADKLLLLSSLGALVATPTSVCTIPGWFFSLLLAKEVILIGGVVVLVSLGSKIELSPTHLSKFATASQLTLLFLIMCCLRMCWVLPSGLYSFMLGACALIACAALVQYGYVGFRVLLKSVLRGGL